MKNFKVKEIIGKTTGKRGFTLTELVVTISIVVVIMSVVLFNYSKSEDKLALSTATQEVAIAIRQAQVYGTSVRESSAGSRSYNYNYGISFCLSDPSNYYIYVDSDGNGHYTGSAGGTSCSGTSGESVEKGSLRNGVTISAICDSITCPAASPTGAQWLDIQFTRPNITPKIKIMDANGIVLNSLNSSVGKIIFRSPQGTVASTTITTMGQISI